MVQTSRVPLASPAGPSGDRRGVQTERMEPDGRSGPCALCRRPADLVPVLSWRTGTAETHRRPSDVVLFHGGPRWPSWIGIRRLGCATRIQFVSGAATIDGGMPYARAGAALRSVGTATAPTRSPGTGGFDGVSIA